MASKAAPEKALKKFTWAEVKKHNTPSDAWIVYHNKVYDVSNWHEHPGGAVVFTHAGDDATDIFAAFHAPGSQQMMKKFLIGTTKKKKKKKKRGRNTWCIFANVVGKSTLRRINLQTMPKVGNIKPTPRCLKKLEL